MSKRPPQTLSIAEESALLEELLMDLETEPSQKRAIRNHLIAVLMLDAGLRVGEVISLVVSDLVFSSMPVKWLDVRDEIAKYGAGRRLYVTERLSEAIDNAIKFVWLKDEAGPGHKCFYSSKKGHCITAEQVERIIKAAGIRSIRRDIHPHVLRHTFATNMMRVTSSRVLQEMLGHKNLSSTQVYTHPANSDHIKAMEKMQKTRDRDTGKK